MVKSCLFFFWSNKVVKQQVGLIIFLAKCILPIAEYHRIRGYKTVKKSMNFAERSYLVFFLFKR